MPAGAHSFQSPPCAIGTKPSCPLACCSFMLVRDGLPLSLIRAATHHDAQRRAHEVHAVVHLLAVPRGRELALLAVNGVPHTARVEGH